MNRSQMAAVALAACCAALPISAAADWHKADRVSVVNQTSVTLTQAIAHAISTVGGRAIEAELEVGKWGGASGWEVELITANGMKTELWVDAQSGQVSWQRSKPAKSKYARQLDATAISMEQAIDAALAQVAGHAISAELEVEHNTVVFEVKVLRADGLVQELVLDARDGRVLAQRWDD